MQRDDRVTQVQGKTTDVIRVTVTGVSFAAASAAGGSVDQAADVCVCKIIRKKKNTRGRGTVCARLSRTISGTHPPRALVCM